MFWLFLSCCRVLKRASLSDHPGQLLQVLAGGGENAERAQASAVERFDDLQNLQDSEQHEISAGVSWISVIWRIHLVSRIVNAVELALRNSTRKRRGGAMTLDWYVGFEAVHSFSSEALNSLNLWLSGTETMFSAEGIQRNCVLQTLIQRPLASSLQSLYRCSYRKHSILYLFIICCKHYLKELDGHSVLLNIAAFLQLCAMIQIVSLDFPGIGSNSRRPDIPDDALVIFSDLDEVKGENLQSGLKRFKRICSAGPVCQSLDLGAAEDEFENLITKNQSSCVVFWERRGSQRLLRPSRCWGLAKAQKQRRPINAFLDSKSWVADAKRKDLGFKSTTLCLTIFVIWPQRWWLEKVKWLYGAVLSQHTVAPRLDARASRVVKDHRSVELRILQRPNVLSMSSIHSVTPKHGLSRTRCSNALLHLVPTWCHDFPFFDFFWEAALSRGFCHHGLPPSQEGLFGIEVGTLCNGNSDQAPFSVDQVQHKNEY